MLKTLIELNTTARLNGSTEAGQGDSGMGH